MAENIRQMDNSITRKQCLKDLLDKAGQIRITDNIEDNILAVNEISKIIVETDFISQQGDIEERVNNTGEVVMDAHVIQLSHELIGEILQRTGNTKFSDEEWINAIIGLAYKDDNENWSELFKLTCKIPKTAKFSSSLLGGFNLLHDVIPNTEKEKQRRRSKIDKFEQPVNVSQLEIYDRNTQSVLLIYRKILNVFVENKRTPIPYYELIIDPNDYMKTVDNALKVAFLARDKSVAIEFNEDNFPTIKPLTNEKAVNVSNESSHAISTINPQIYRDMIEKYQIKTPMLN